MQTVISLLSCFKCCFGKISGGQFGVVIDVNTGQSRHVQVANKTADEDKAKEDNQKENRSKQNKDGRSRSAKKRPKSPKGSHFDARKEGMMYLLLFLPPTFHRKRR